MGRDANRCEERVEQLFADETDTTIDSIVLGWMESIGPTTNGNFAAGSSLPDLDAAMQRLDDPSSSWPIP